MNSDAGEIRTGSASLSITSSFSPTPRRLSTNYIPCTEPVRAKKQLSSVLTRLEKTSSANHINDGVAWELLGPIVLVHAAAAHVKKSKLVSELRESVQLRVSFFFRIFVLRI